MSLTSNCLDSSFEMKSYCLALKEITAQHTGGNICNAINEIIQEWDMYNIVPTKIPRFAVTDGAVNINLQ